MGERYNKLPTNRVYGMKICYPEKSKYLSNTLQMLQRLLTLIVMPVPVFVIIRHWIYPKNYVRGTLTIQNLHTVSLCHCRSALLYLLYVTAGERRRYVYQQWRCHAFTSKGQRGILVGKHFTATVYSVLEICL